MWRVCSMCLTDLYVKLLNHNIAHVTYDAEIAGIRFASLNWPFVVCVLLEDFNLAGFVTPSHSPTAVCMTFPSGMIQKLFPGFEDTLSIPLPWTTGILLSVAHSVGVETWSWDYFCVFIYWLFLSYCLYSRHYVSFSQLRWVELIIPIIWSKKYESFFLFNKE